LPRLGETLACSKLSESPRRPLVREGLGEPLLASPGRDMLAWASLTIPATAMSVKDVFCTNQQHTNHFKRSPQHTRSRIIKCIAKYFTNTVTVRF